MKVRELIEQLERFDQDGPVVVADDDGARMVKDVGMRHRAAHGTHPVIYLGGLAEPRPATTGQAVRDAQAMGEERARAEEMMTVGSVWLSPGGYRLRILTAKPGKRLRVMRLEPPSVAGVEISISRIALLTAYDPEDR